jgi:uncharacterized protein (DUF427 family)
MEGYALYMNSGTKKSTREPYAGTAMYTSIKPEKVQKVSL